ncbi:MAG: hypothetical protein WC806_03080 [Candidatus Gracilibacteria bacterium]|jgi:hypothetical protein
MKKQKNYIISILIILVILIGICGFYLQTKKWEEESKYKAVFLNNGQVYFGKVSHQYSNWVDLKDIYYLQIKEPLQDQAQVPDAQNNLNLVKLGNELHGPTDEMQIQKDNILFIETLSTESKVLKAIIQQKNG